MTQLDSLKTILFDVDDAGIALLTINRPDKLNALNATVLAELDECIRHVAGTDTIRGLIITGAGPKAFVAGADIGEFSALSAETGQKLAQRGQTVFSHIEELGKPVIAAVNGYALGGGCELAMACHLRVASENAAFGQPEVDLGIIPGYGGTQRLPRLIGHGRALELILTSRRIAAQEAYTIGLVNQVVPASALLETAQSLIQTILSKAPVAIRMALGAVYAADRPLAQGLAHEALLFGQTCATDDFKEGVTAFQERRKANFKGK